MPTPVAFQHGALLYATEDEYQAAVLQFVSEGTDNGEPVFVAVPQQRVSLLRSQLTGSAAAVRFADMAELGVNPNRIIPQIREFIDEHEDRTVRFVGEPIWRGRSPAEIVEATRHEALINYAFADAPAHILCPYDARLPTQVLADASRTHPEYFSGTEWTASADYADPLVVSDAEAWPLPMPPSDVEVIAYRTSAALPAVRQLVRERASAAGLDPDRVHDVVLAVDELCTNTLRHARGSGALRMWDEPGGLVCEIRDSGVIDDPLAGRHRVGISDASGRGLYLVYQLSDLTEIRSTKTGTVIRAHFAVDRSDGSLTAASPAGRNRRTG